MAYKRGVFAEIRPSITKFLKRNNAQSSVNTGGSSSGTDTGTDNGQYTAKLGVCALGKMILGKAE